VVVVELSKAGNQVPVIPLLDVVGNADKTQPEQIAGTWVNIGIGCCVTEIVINVVVAHWPVVGVKI